MNFNQFTIKAQEAVQEAVNLTQARGQQAIEPVHLHRRGLPELRPQERYSQDFKS